MVIHAFFSFILRIHKIKFGAFMQNYETVLVTGASAGFGYSICELLSKEGFHVIALARRKEKLETLALNTPKIMPLPFDVTQNENILDHISKLPSPFNHVDVLINNAGLALGQDRSQNCSLNDWHTMVNTNINGVLNLTHDLLPDMLKRNLGYIINLGSTAGAWPYQGGNVYGATKAFIEQFSRNLRTDVAGSAVKVSVIKPGLCQDTEFSYTRFSGDEKKVEAVYKDTQAIKPDDIAKIILYLLNTPAYLNINAIEMMPVCQTYGGLSVTRNVNLTPNKDL